MNHINIFLEHIFEACSQRSISLEQMLREAHDMGYTGLECDLWRLSDGESVKKMFDSCGLKAASIYSHYDFPHDTSEETFSKMKAHINTAVFFGAEKIMAIPGFIREGDDRDDVFSKCCEQLTILTKLAGEHGLTVTVEDFDDINSPCCNIDGLEKLLSGSEGLKFTLDTGNFAYVKENPCDACDRLGQYISHVHLKDRSYDCLRAAPDESNAKADISGEIMYPCEVGGGFIGIEKLVKRLISEGYSGDFSVEHFGACDQTFYMQQSVNNVKQWIEEARNDKRTYLE